MKIIFVNRFFYPDVSATSQMLSDQAFGLAEQGREIIVVASRYGYHDKSQRFPDREEIDGVTVHRVRTTNFGRSGLLGRALDYMSFLLSSSWLLLILVRPGDIVVAKTDPPLLSALAYLVCAVRGAKLVNWLQDLFPEAATTLKIGCGETSKLMLTLLGWLRNYSLRRARANVVIGAGMACRVEQLGVDPRRIAAIPNWSNGRTIYPIPHDENALRRNWGLQDTFVIAHSGNLGRAHDYRTFLQAIIELEQEQPSIGVMAQRSKDFCRSNEGTAIAERILKEAQSMPIRWLFIGGGVHYEKLRQEVAKRHLTSVSFRGYQPREDLAASLSCADVHLVTLRNEMEGVSVPSKVYGSLAAGRPVVFVGDRQGEVAGLLRRYECGFSIREGDGAGLVRLLRRLTEDAALTEEIGERARRVLEEKFELQHALARWQVLLDRIDSEP